MTSWDNYLEFTFNFLIQSLVYFSVLIVEEVFWWMDTETHYWTFLVSSAKTRKNINLKNYQKKQL